MVTCLDSQDQVVSVMVEGRRPDLINGFCDLYSSELGALSWELTVKMLRYSARVHYDTAGNVLAEEESRRMGAIFPDPLKRLGSDGVEQGGGK